MRSNIARKTGICKVVIIRSTFKKSSTKRCPRCVLCNYNMQLNNGSYVDHRRCLRRPKSWTNYAQSGRLRPARCPAFILRSCSWRETRLWRQDFSFNQHKFISYVFNMGINVKTSCAQRRV